MKAVLPLLALLVQLPEPDLYREFRATQTGTPHAIVSLIAIEADGTPVRGTIQCSGYWFKYADEETTAEGWALPFVTDARGAIVMNPRTTDAPFLCWSEIRGHRGEVIVDLAASDQRVF